MKNLVIHNVTQAESRMLDSLWNIKDSDELDQFVSQLDQPQRLLCERMQLELILAATEADGTVSLNDVSQLLSKF